jgi:hypothetical protein
MDVPYRRSERGDRLASEDHVGLPAISRRRTIEPFTHLLLACIGLLVGSTIAWVFPGSTLAVQSFRETDWYVIWVAFVAAQGALWASMAPTALRTLARLLEKIHGRRWPRSLGPYVAAYVFIALLINAFLVFFTRSNEGSPLAAHEFRATGMFVLGSLVSGPATICILAIHRQVGVKTNIATELFDPAHAIGDLLYFRTVLQRSLVMLGSIIGAATLGAGALRNAAIASGFKTPEGAPVGYVLLYGALFTLVIALIYIPCYFSLQTRAKELCDLLLPIPTGPRPVDAEGLLDWSEKRQKLESLLRVGVGVGDSFQAAFGIFAPLASSVLLVLLPNGS